MAINKVITKPPKIHAGLKNCLTYVLRSDKTEQTLTSITGPYKHKELNANFAYQSFLQEKKIWDKDKGRMCSHSIISWHKDEKITQEEAFAFGQEFAEKWFAGFQTVIAVHQDRDHIHCHMVTNSVSYEDGRKYHSSKRDLEQMKLMTNEMCKKRNLTVAEKGKHFDGTAIEAGEVISWNQEKYQLFKKDARKSYLWECANSVVNVMKQCISREQFIEKMEKYGWQVHWKDTRKYITFENREGKKVRDVTLAKTFHLEMGKEVLEHEFIRQRGEAESAEQELKQYYRQLKDIDAGNVTETQRDLVSESRVIKNKSECARRTAEGFNRSVRYNEAQSTAEHRERQLEEQRRMDAEREAREARKRNRKRSGPER